MFYDPESKLAFEWTEGPEDAEERKHVIRERQFVLSEMTSYARKNKGFNRRVQRIRAKTCIVWGKHDGLVPVDYAYEFQKHISDSIVKIIDQAAHFPHLEQLSDVLDISISFLKSDHTIGQAGL
jgi:pimeloyl-ACP methyl ester carboxylesterase